MAVRRLPVLQTSTLAEEPTRPSWHWIVIGAGFVITMWLPLTMIAVWVAPRLAAWLMPNGRSGAVAALAVAPIVLALALASLGGGALVARFGTGASRRHTVAAGVLAATIAWCLALALGTLGEWVVAAASWGATAAIAAAFCVLGGWLATRKRGIVRV
jgi:hypothetical protein